MKKIGTFLFLLLLATACQNDKVYDTFLHTPLSGWEKNDTLTFNIPQIRKSDVYYSGLTLRINNDFPFKSLTLIVEQTIWPSHARYTDTLNCNLIGDNGIAKGHGVSYYQYDFPIRNLHLQTGDSLHIQVRHDMKREILPGVSNIGINLSHR